MNWIIFIIIFITLLRKRRNSEVGEDVKTRLRQQFIAALTLSLLFGLGWGVGFASTSSITSVPLSATLQAIFILLTSFQGLLIFIMHCVRCEEAHNVWKEWIFIITCHKVQFSKPKSQSMAISKLKSCGSGKPRTTPSKQTLKTESDNMEKEQQKKLENGESHVKESTLSEKKISSPSEEELVNIKILPHQESETPTMPRNGSFDYSTTVTSAAILSVDAEEGKETVLQ